MQATTEVLSHPDKQTPMRQLAGMREAETLKNMQIEQKDRDGKKILTSYGFAQSLAYIQKEMPDYKFSDQQLFDAYMIAGTRFGPEIGHYFIILDMEI